MAGCRDRTFGKVKFKFTNIPILSPVPMLTSMYNVVHFWEDRARKF